MSTADLYALLSSLDDQEKERLREQLKKQEEKEEEKEPKDRSGEAKGGRGNKVDASKVKENRNDDGDDDDDDDNDEEEEEVRDDDGEEARIAGYEGPQYDHVFAQYRKAGTSAGNGGGGALSGLRWAKPIITHAEGKRGRRRGKRRHRRQSDGQGSGDTAVRSQVIAAPNSDSKFQVWDFSSALDEEQPWHRDEDEVPRLVTEKDPSGQVLLRIEPAVPSGSSPYTLRAPRRYTNLHSSFEDSDTDGYALGQAYRRRLDLSSSYASPSDRLDVYKPDSSVSPINEEGLVTEEAKEASLDDLWAGLSDNQAFQNFEDLLLQLREKEGDVAFLNPDQKNTSNSGYASQPTATRNGYSNSSSRRPQPTPATERTAPTGAYGYKNAYGAAPSPFFAPSSMEGVTVLPPPVVPLYPNFSVAAGYSSSSPSNSGYGARFNQIEQLDPFALTKSKVERSYLGGIGSSAYKGALPPAGRGRGRPIAEPSRDLPVAGRGRGRGQADVPSTFGYKPTISEVQPAAAYKTDKSASGFWPTSLLFGVFNFGAPSTITADTDDQPSDSVSSGEGEVMRRVPSEPTFIDENEESPYTNNNHSENGVAYSTLQGRKLSSNGLYSSLHSSGYSGAIQEGGEGAGVCPLFDSLGAIDEEEDEEAYQGIADSDSYHLCDGIPVEDESDEEPWIESDALTAGSSAYENASSRNAGDYTVDEMNDGDDEDDVTSTQRRSNKKSSAAVAIDMGYCDVHSPRAASEWDSLKRDWTQEFHRIIRGMDDTSSVYDAKKRMQVAEKLQALYTEFVSVAKAIGETIIRERSLPNHLKTIKPSDDFGGIAGGEKFCVANIFFKFAIDNNNIYGNDGLAAKCAGHELKAASALFSCAMLVGLHSPLVVLLDWWGYRLMCYSMLPISPETLAYGSADGGNTVHSGIKELNKRIKTVAKVLNLKGHWAGLTQKRYLYTCCDIEGHRGTDGHYYVVDAARLFPPEAPQEGAASTSFLYRLLRPEFVREYERPLSSDAFSKFGEDDYRVHNQEVRNASERLKVEVIRRFAEELESTLNSTSTWPYAGDSLIHELHRRGINVRYLANMLYIVSSTRLRALLLSELIARAIKWDIRAAVRSKVKQELKQAQLESKRRRLETLTTAPSPTPLTPTSCDRCRKCTLERSVRQLVCQCFQRVFAGDGIEGLWSRVQPRLKSIYPGFEGLATANGSKDMECETLRHVSLLDVLARVESMLGVAFAKPFDNGKLTLEVMPTWFTEERLPTIEMRTKEAYILPRIQADCYALLAARKKARLGSGSSAKKNEVVCYYRMAAGLYENVIKCKANDEYSLYNWGLALFHTAELEENVDLAKEALDKWSGCMDVCRRAVPPNHDLAALGLKATAECYAHLASNRVYGSAAPQQIQWLFLQADRYFTAAYDIFCQLSSSSLASLRPIPTLSISLSLPSALPADLAAFFNSLPSAMMPAGGVNWIGGEHEDEILRLLYNWANMRRDWAATYKTIANSPVTHESVAENIDEVSSQRRIALLQASRTLFKLCLPAIERWTSEGKNIEGDNKEQEDLRKANDRVPIMPLQNGEHRAKLLEDVTNAAEAASTPAAKLTREQKEKRERRRWAARVLANCGVTLVELGRQSSTTALPVHKPQREWWAEAKAKFNTAEDVDPGIGAYNLGCVAALEGNMEECRKWLEKCKRDEKGPAVELWTQDEDLAPVHDKAWFKELLPNPASVASVSNTS